jgi:hypothetical protein
VIAASLWMLADALIQPGVDDLKGDFKELAFVRNEQNSGPVMRFYAASVRDTLWDEFEKYGDFMPHTKYGTTKVYFFLPGAPMPENLFLEDGGLSPESKRYCIGIYEKNGMSQVYITKYPFIR